MINFIFVFKLFTITIILIPVSVECSVGSDFRNLVMYLTEPLINDQSVNGVALNGAERENMAAFLDDAIEKVTQKEAELHKHQINFDQLRIFQKALKKGSAIGARIEKTMNIDMAIDIQNSLIDNLNGDDWIYVPAGWIGSDPHAIVLGFHKNTNGTFDMTVINTGDGVGNHFSIQDPNGMYPFITQFWLEFKNIAKDDIFDDVAWFVKALMLLNQRSFVRGKEPLATYFYGSILANFRKYLHEDRVFDVNLMMVVQRSGTCVLSSMLAAMLNSLRDVKSFQLFRLMIGQEILKEFFEKHRGNPEFNPFINNGTKLFGRKIFSSLASGIANLAAQYLEAVYPETFKNSILIGGLRREIWLREKKEAAIKVLSEDELSLELLRTTADLGVKVKEVLKETPIDPETTLLKISKDERKKLKNRTVRNDYQNNFEMGKLLTDLRSPYEYLSAPVTRSTLPLVTLNELTSALKTCIQIHPNSNFVFTCALDSFKRSGTEGHKWWSMIDTTSGNDKPQILELLKTVSSLAAKYVQEDKKLKSFDEFLLMSYLQLAAWKCAKLYDKFSGGLLELESFASPNLIQKLLNEKNVSAGNYNNLFIWSSFSSQNLKLLDEVMQELGADSDIGPRFAGPYEFISDIGATGFKYDYIKFDNQNAKLYEKLGKLPEIERILKNKIDAVKLGHRNARLVALLHGVIELSSVIPHFHELLNTLFWIYWGMSQNNFALENSKSFIATNFDDMKECEFNVNKKSGQYTKYYSFLEVDTKGHELLPIQSRIHFGFMPKHIDFFSLSRRIDAFSENPSDKRNIINVETWLNYVKGALDSEIFASPHFQYISDKLLNTPIIKVVGNNRLSLNPSDTYPEGFEPRHITEIYEALTDILVKELKKIGSKSAHLTINQVSDLIRKSVRIGIILARFLERIENDKLIPGNYSAQLLAKLYSYFYNFGLIKNSLPLTDLDISLVNLLLAQICSFDLRSSREFFLNINLDIKNKSNIRSYRKVLARTHMFVSKMTGYETHGALGIEHDLQATGIPFHPVDSNEVEFSNQVLKVLFLSRYAPNVEWTDFKYGKDGNIVEITSSTGDSKLSIQLSNGLWAINGIPVAQTVSTFYYRPFTQIFNAEDWKEATKGEAFRIGSNTVYLIENFKDVGINFLFVKSDESFGLSMAFRQFNKKWYYFDENHKVPLSFIHLDGVNDECFKGYQYYKKAITRKELIKPFEKEPDYEEELEVTEYDHLMLNNDSNVPFMHVNYSTHLYGESPVEVTFPAHNLKCQSVSASGTNPPRFSEHLESFKASNIGYCRKSSNQMVFIFADYKVKGEPLVLVERENNGEIASAFDILNLPGYFVEANQTIDGVIGIQGTLRIKNDDDETFLLVPVTERSTMSRKNFLGFKIIKKIELIPILNDQITPQTRYHRVLLAYYATLASEFKLARDLLHPVTSIHQNEVFSAQELEVIEWFLHINIKIPEVHALRSFVYIHLMLNQRKFPLEYCDQGSLYATLVKNILGNVNHVAPGVIFDHLMTIRDLSEKFHLPKVFPEMSDPKFFTTVYSKISAFKFMEIAGDPKEVLKGVPYSLYEPNESVIKHPNLKMLLDHFTTPSDANLKFPIKFLKRQAHEKGQIVKNTSSAEMAIYCMLNSNRAVWKPFFDHLEKEFKRKNTITSNFESDIRNQLFLKAFEECSIFSSDFDLVQTNSKGVKLNLDIMYETLKNPQSDHKTADCSFNLDLKLIKTEDLIEFDKVMKALQEVTLFADGSELHGKIFQGTVTSPVLDKLKTSIGEYLKENNGIRVTGEIEVERRLRESLEAFRLYCEAAIKLHQDRQLEMTSDLLSKADLGRETSAILDLIMRLMHGKKKKTFSDLYSCYQNGSIDCFHKKFPKLSLKECEDLRIDTAEFYSHGVLVDYLKFLLGKVEEILQPAKRTAIEEILNFMDELSKVNDFNERIQNQTILNLEFRSQKYRLKPEQVKDVGMLTNSQSPSLFDSVVIQRMMAAGKTLILGTISVIKKAEKCDTLSILVPPSSLYQSNTTAMQARTYQYFKKKGQTFDFPRFPSSSDDSQQIEFMQNILNLIKSTIKDGNYLILSPESLHSFLNSYIEALDSASETNLEKLKLFAEIHEIFRTKSSIILDEIDMTMDPRKELNFPTIEREPFNMIAATLITDLIEFATFDRDILNLHGLDIYGNNQAKLSSDQYNQVKTKFLEYIEEQLKQEHSSWRSMLKITGSVDEVMEFLTSDDMNYKRDWIKRIHDHENQVVANALIIIKVQLHKYLKESFKATANLNYGLAGNNRPDIHYAVPYVAANTPSTSSEFADRWETLNKTLLMFASAPCNRSVAASIIKYISDSIVKESGPTRAPESTTTWNNMTTLISGINPLSLNESKAEDIELVYQALKFRSPAAIRIIFAYCVDVVFTAMNFATEQVTSNALNVASMFASVQGYSGTIDNVNILPQEVIAKAYDDNLKNEKNNGGIAYKLINDTQDSIVPEIEDEHFSSDAQSFVKIIFQKFESSAFSGSDKISAIIDSGAFFKNFNNYQVAEAILNEREKIRAVLYYNETTNQLEFVRKSGNTVMKGFLSTTDPDSISKMTQTNLEERFTFYDHRHITGSDILQRKDAQAILTVGTRVLLRDILQGTLRMRQFMTSQKVHLITSAAAKEFYFSRIGRQSSETVKVSDMITLGAINEDDKQQFENEKLAFVKIDTEMRRFVLDEITNLIQTEENSINRIATLFRRSRHLFIRQIRENPLDWLMKHEIQDSKLVLKDFIESRIRSLKSTFDDVESNWRFTGLNEKLNAMVADSKSPESLLTFLKPTMTKKVADIQGSEVEMQLEVNVLVDLNLEVLIDVYKDNFGSIDHETFDIQLLDESDESSELPIFEKQFMSLNSVLLDPEMQEIYRPMTENVLLSDGKHVAASLDILEVVGLTDIHRKPFKIFSKFTREATHLLVQRTSKGVRVVLLSSTAAQYVYKSLKEAVGLKSTFWLCDLSASITITNDLSAQGNILDILPEINLLIFDALIFNGSLSQIISSPHLHRIYLENWLNNKAAAERAKFLLLRMKSLFNKLEKTISRSNPHILLLDLISRGDSSIIQKTTKETDVEFCKRPPITPEIEHEICTQRGISKQVKSEKRGQRRSSTIDVYDVFRETIGELRPSAREGELVEFGLTAGIAQCDVDKV